MSASTRIRRLERFTAPAQLPAMPDEAAYPVAAVAKMFGARLDAPGVVERFWAALGYEVNGPEDRTAALDDAEPYFAVSHSCRPEPYAPGWVDYLIRLNAEIYGLDAAALRAAGRQIAGPEALGV